MKPLFSPTDLLFPILLALLALRAPATCSAVEPSIEVGGAEIAYRQLQTAFHDGTEPELAALVAAIPNAVGEREIAAKLLSGLRAMGQEPESPRMMAVADWFSLLMHGKAEWVQNFAVTNNPQWNSSTLARVWLDSEDRTIRGFADFIDQQGRWKWLPPLDPNAPTAPAYRYDLSTPSRAFLTLKRAQDPGHDGIADFRGIHRALGSPVRTAVSIEEYGRAVESRRADSAWERPDFSCAEQQLEEEVLPVADGKQTSRVWRLDAKGKRKTFEIFIKEGNEWRWLPDPKSTWHVSTSNRLVPSTPTKRSSP